ncbi:MAG: Uma2 family endonuclease [Nitrospinae bacterium]|nr:Uma2 family endonuclease [Nitrospinota bacterium]
MGHPLKKKDDRRYTWSDYLTWPDEERWEVIDGVAYDMSPSPTPRHQIITGNFFSILKDKLKGKSCRPLIAPLDVYFDDHNFVQPDVLVICDEKKIKDRIYGAPDLVIEILSPSTSLKDKRAKRNLYEKFGVKEYIIVSSEDVFVERYLLIEGRFKEPDILGSNEVITLSSLEGIEIQLWEVFEVEPPDV